MVRVRNAVILAAGAATRFVPLSLEQPKGLFEVGGERLIDRQIAQLREAGIADITVVVGYKKEQFAYLKDQFGVTLVDNPLFAVKNNIESLRLVRDRIGDSYICSSDDYFTDNPFRCEEPFSFYAGFVSDCKTNEMYVDLDADSRIVRMEKDREAGPLLLGHSFWTRAFAEAFFRIVEEDREGHYDTLFWERLVRDHLADLPPFYFKAYPEGQIHEFDYFEELRAFDRTYLTGSNSRILAHIRSVFHCAEEDIVRFRCIREGLTNTSFVFRIGEKDYIYRHPGDGTDRIINRRHERTSLEHARDLGLDPTYIYMDVDEGWKISHFIPSFREPEYGSEADSAQVLEVLRRLHGSDVRVDYGLQPWEDALRIEALLPEGSFEPFRALKERVGACYAATLGDGVRKCFCHGDTYRHNWLIEPSGRVVLIDWEYAGMSDPGIDVGYYIVDAEYDFPQAKAFIRTYLQDAWTPELEAHYLAYTALIAYYWFVWALYREACGAPMGESLDRWHRMAERYCTTPINR